MTCNDCIHRFVCYRVDSVPSDYAQKCGDFESGCKALEQKPSSSENPNKWIPCLERLPNKGQWVLVITEDYQKPIEIMRYQGIRIGKKYNGNGWEEYEYPSWTSGHGDVQDYHPKAWMSLPEPYKVESEEV